MDITSGKQVLAALIAIVTVVSLGNQYANGSLTTLQSFVSAMLLIFVIALFASKRLRESYISNLIVSLLAFVVAGFTFVTNEGDLAYIVVAFWVLVGILGIYQIVQQTSSVRSET